MNHGFKTSLPGHRYSPTRSPPCSSVTQQRLSPNHNLFEVYSLKMLASWSFSRKLAMFSAFCASFRSCFLTSSLSTTSSSSLLLMAPLLPPSSSADAPAMQGPAQHSPCPRQPGRKGEAGHVQQLGSVLSLTWNMLVLHQ